MGLRAQPMRSPSRAAGPARRLSSRSRPGACTRRVTLQRVTERMMDLDRWRGWSGSRPPWPGLGQAQPVHPHELGERVDGPALEARAGAAHLLRQARRAPRRAPRRPGPGGDADRAVPVLHRGVGLGPELGRLAQLEGGLRGQPDGPAATRRRSPARRRPPRPGTAPRPRRARPGRRAIAADRSSPSEARSSARVEVANRVCTTDFSSTSGSRMVRSASSVTGGPGWRRSPS